MDLGGGEGGPAAALMRLAASCAMLTAEGEGEEEGEGRCEGGEEAREGTAMLKPPREGNLSLVLQ